MKIDLDRFIKHNYAHKASKCCKQLGIIHLTVDHYGN